ncbi:MAG: hypothetical protein H6733_15620 [Alphaproteobacteria bacterium]|nr:hypothetical protein [Alphaproteobacteria bacterium]
MPKTPWNPADLPASSMTAIQGLLRLRDQSGYSFRALVGALVEAEMERRGMVREGFVSVAADPSERGDDGGGGVELTDGVWLITGIPKGEENPANIGYLNSNGGIEWVAVKSAFSNPLDYDDFKDETVSFKKVLADPKSTLSAFQTYACANLGGPGTVLKVLASAVTSSGTYTCPMI